MHKAALYQRSNGLQRRDAQQVLDEFSQVLHWRSDGCDSLLDIGCGSGDVTIDFILPIMPLNFSRMVGADLSEQMLLHAREHYPHPKITFDKIDIESDLEKYMRNVEPFDHITSFYCLHWVQNQKKAIQNIYNLLDAGGDCLLVFLGKNPIFEIYKELSKNEKWSKYMTDVDRFISPYQYSKNPADDFGSVLFASGFTNYSVEIREKLFIFEGVELLKSQCFIYFMIIFSIFFFFLIFLNFYFYFSSESVKAVNPFLERMPLHEHDNFLDDYVNVVTKMQLKLDAIDISSQNCRFLTPYKLLIAYARK